MGGCQPIILSLSVSYPVWYFSCLVPFFPVSCFLSCPILFLSCLVPALSCLILFLPPVPSGLNLFPCPVLSGFCLACFLPCSFPFSPPYLLCFRSCMLIELCIFCPVCSLSCPAPVVPGSSLACFLSSLVCFSCLVWVLSFHVPLMAGSEAN